jgi:hypothetical protein
VAACKPGSFRRIIFYVGESEPEYMHPQVGDFLRHPVTGSTYKVLARGHSHAMRGYSLHLEGLGLLADPEGERLIYYAIHPSGRYWHEDSA